MSTTDKRPWSELGADEKTDARYAAWRDLPLPFASPQAEQAYLQRVQRLTTAMRLQGEPDRVPVPLCVVEVYPAIRKGLTPYDAMYDFDRAAEAFVEFNQIFQPDGMVAPMAGTLPGRAFELLDYKLYSWPSRGVPKEGTYQYNEAEWMHPEEYPALIADPSDFLLRTYLPRISGAFSGFAKLGTVLDPSVMSFSPGFIASWAQPEVVESLERAVKAGKEMAAWLNKAIPLMGRIMGEGFPAFIHGASEAPFDFLGDNLRGTKGVLMDLYRRPEQVLEACDRLVPLMVRWVTEKTSPATGPGIFMPLHKGADGFMSDEQFKTFYWPTLLKVIHGLVDEGFTPILFAEGAYDSRLEILAAGLPKGKTVWYFDRTDMARAKATVGQVACIQGNVPLSLVHAGTPGQMREYVRQLIEVAAPGGGFMLDLGAVMHHGKDENLMAMMEAAREYGVYQRD